MLDDNVLDFNNGLRAYDTKTESRLTDAYPDRETSIRPRVEGAGVHS